jgi:beta-lactamase superfamily II metal-dependent hydrolase
MFGLRVIQAEHGDCLLLEYGNGTRRYALIDGGPPEIYTRHLEPILRGVAQRGGKLDAVVLSHVDGDHITGLIDFFADMRDTGKYIAIDRFWMNSFTQVEGSGLEPNLRALPNVAGIATPNTTATLLTIDEGNTLARFGFQIGLTANSDRPHSVMTVGSEPDVIPLDNLELTVVGPTQTNVDALREKWEQWIEDQTNALAGGDIYVMANSDRSVPNLSSIMLYAKSDGASMLLTGDGRSDHLLEGLDKAGLLDAAGKLHVTLLKLPHHGSNRNATKTFFRKVTADIYVASANGRDDNPDLATLIWIVEAAERDKRAIRIFVTNETPSTRQLLDEYPPNDYGYELEILPAGTSSQLIELVS